MVLIFASYCYLFIICSVLGYYLEGFWSLLTRGFFEHHASTLWGPFCLIYGIGAVVLFWIYPKIKNKSLLYQWFIFSIIATLIEYLTHWGQELFFQTYSWNYSNHFLNLQGRVSLPMSIAWGLLGLLFTHLFIPFYQRKSKSYYSRQHQWMALILCILMIVNVICTFVAVFFWTHNQSEVISYLDEETMQEKFPNMHFY